MCAGNPSLPVRSERPAWPRWTCHRGATGRGRTRTTCLKNIERARARRASENGAPALQSGPTRPSRSAVTAEAASTPSRSVVQGAVLPGFCDVDVYDFGFAGHENQVSAGPGVDRAVPRVHGSGRCPTLPPAGLLGVVGRRWGRRGAGVLSVCFVVSLPIPNSFPCVFPGSNLNFRTRFLRDST